MLTPPQFNSPQELRASFGNIAYWQPLLQEILQRHGLPDAERDTVSGFNPTFPTFICGDVVIKLFGFLPIRWRASHAGECAAHELLATDPTIAAPRLLGQGHMFADTDTPWLYLMTRRVEGTSVKQADLSLAQQRAVAAELGRQVNRIHALPAVGISTDKDWPEMDITAANRQSSLPSHLVAQIDNYLKGMGPFDRVFLHGDIVANHVYIEEGRLTGIIDWGDAMVTDRHFDIIQIHRELFACNKTLLRIFLDAANWPLTREFSYKAMYFALFRQAIGLIQHGGRMDVFEPVAEQFPLLDVATLDELAEMLFGV